MARFFIRNFCPRALPKSPLRQLNSSNYGARKGFTEKQRNRGRGDTVEPNPKSATAVEPLPYGAQPRTVSGHAVAAQNELVQTLQAFRSRRQRLLKLNDPVGHGKRSPRQGRQHGRVLVVRV